MMSSLESSKSAVGERSDRSLSVLSIIGMPSFGELGVTLLLGVVKGVEAGGALLGDVRSLTEIELCESPAISLGAVRIRLLGVRGVSGTLIRARVCTPIEWGMV